MPNEYSAPTVSRVIPLVEDLGPVGEWDRLVLVALEMWSSGFELRYASYGLAQEQDLAQPAPEWEVWDKLGQDHHVAPAGGAPHQVRILGLLASPEDSRVESLGLGLGEATQLPLHEGFILFRPQRRRKAVCAVVEHPGMHKTEPLSLLSSEPFKILVEGIDRSCQRRPTLVRPQGAFDEMKFRYARKLASERNGKAGYPMPMARSIEGGTESGGSPRASMVARSTLMASRSRSIQVSQGPGGMVDGSPSASTQARR